MTPLRKLQGISYWVIEDPNGIRDFVNTNLRKELETDARDNGLDPNESSWLKTLPEREWRLQIVHLDKIVLNTDVMNFVDAKRSYSFRESLARRVRALRGQIEKYGVVIWPIVVAAEGMVLIDGYCRLAALREMGVFEAYAYIGALSTQF